MLDKSVIHDLRAPLAVIHGIVCNLLDGVTGELSDKQKDYLGKAKKQSLRMADLIEKLNNDKGAANA